MPDFEDGFKALFISLVLGFALSAIVSSFLEASIGESGKSMALLINLLFTFMGLIQLERSKYWGLSYTVGYFCGLVLFGGYFLEGWESSIYFLVIALFIVQKVLRKLKSHY
jgi:hypothetical protein